MLSTQARSTFVSIDEGRAELRGCALETKLWLVCADDLLERCNLARESNSERRACSELKAQCAFNASEVYLRLD
ncbi:hypothetical protein CYJ61_00370 [Gardnerella leopoldii]|uniref:Uncharacterized protein n=1 Tax=Gardnerella vaginalis TaxID=2702 RepID=A0AAP8IU98_GARVA|nr:hypothetical protein CYJ61_00370 [Gardnerella vaginalis]